MSTGKVTIITNLNGDKEAVVLPAKADYFLDIFSKDREYYKDKNLIHGLWSSDYTNRYIFSYQIADKLNIVFEEISMNQYLEVCDAINIQPNNVPITEL